MCPWCGNQGLRRVKNMPARSGLGLIAYIILPIALLYWIGTPTYNVCPRCDARWQRGVLVRRRDETPDQTEANTVDAPPNHPVVRRRTRLEGGATHRDSVDDGSDIEIRAHAGACRICRIAAGRYDRAMAPRLPIDGCQCSGGCRCVAVTISSSAEQG